jgi:hypothetical protein
MQRNDQQLPMMIQQNSVETTRLLTCTDSVRQCR